LRRSTAHFSLKQRSPFRNSFIRSRRHSRQTGPQYLATGSLLAVLSPRLRGLQLWKTPEPPAHPEAQEMTNDELNPAPLARPAAVVRDRRYVLDRLDLDARGLQGAHRGLASSARALDHHVHGPHAGVLGVVAGVLRRHLGREGRALARALEPDASGRRPGEDVALQIADRDDRVVEGRLDVRHTVRHDPLLLALGALALLLAAFFGHLRFPSALLLGRLLLARHGAAARPLAGARVGLGALSAHGQAPAMTDAAIAADLHQPLDVLADLLAQVALHPALVLDHLAEAARLVLGQVLDLGDLRHLGLGADVARPRAADPIDVGEPDPDLFVLRQVDSCDTCHWRLPIPDAACVSDFRRSPARRPSGERSCTWDRSA